MPDLHEGDSRRLGMACSCVSVAGLGATRLASAGDGRARVDRRRRRLRSARAERGAGRADCRRLDDHRDRSDSRPARSGAERSAPRTCSIPTRSATDSCSACARWRRGPPIGCGPADATRPAAGPGPARTSSSRRPAPTTSRRSSKPVPDPTGILPMQQAYQMCALGGHLITTSLVRGNITLARQPVLDRRRDAPCGQAGGASPMRDIPRFVELLEKGSTTRSRWRRPIVPLDRMLDAYEQVAYRTTITAIMTA